jgi:hypothetical protein
LVDKRLAAKVFHGHFGGESTAILVGKPRPLWWGILYIKPLCFPVVAPPQSCESVENRKRSALTGGQRASLAFSGRALAPLPHPPRASTKAKTWLWMVGSVQPLRLSVEPCRIEQKGPRTNTEQCRLPPSIQNASMVILPPPTGYESGVPFRFRSRFFRAVHVSCTCIFSRVNRCTCAAHVCATIPACGCLFSARIGCTCARTSGTCAR